MKLSQMFHNVLNYSLEALTTKVEEDSERRSVMLAEHAKIEPSSPKTSRNSSLSLSTEEKALLKALGLSMKSVKTMMQGGVNE
jgi:hypothetical protein